MLSCQTDNSITKSQLVTLKAELTILTDHLASISSQLALPLTINMISNAITLIGSACFLIINRDSGRDHYYLSSVFNLGVYCFVRLVILCAAGNLLVTTFDALIRDLFEAVPRWDFES